MSEDKVKEVANTALSVIQRGYETVRINVSELTVDPDIQRERFNPRKVEKMVADFDVNALGVITVSQRDPVTKVIVDGWHRTSAVRQVTDGNGDIEAHLFKGLSKAEEAQLFLYLNPGNQPTAMDRYRMRLHTKDPDVTAIDKVVHHYGWAVTSSVGNGCLQCVVALERIQRMSHKHEGHENLLQEVMLVVTRAWSTQREGGTATILEGLAYLLLEHGSRIDLDRLIDRLKEYPGGPQALASDAQLIGRTRRMKAPMAVADQITDTYNRQLRPGGPNILPAWRRTK